MSDQIRVETINQQPVTVITPDTPTGDAQKGAMIGGVGGVLAGAMAGAIMGPGGILLGAVVGGVVGAAASGAAIAGVDKIDDDTTFTGVPNELITTYYEDREPLIIDRDNTEMGTEYKATANAPKLDDTPTGWETPIGVGIPEAIAMTSPENTGEYAEEPATIVIVAQGTIEEKPASK